MTHYLARLVQRTLGNPPRVAPRTPAITEPVHWASRTGEAQLEPELASGHGTRPDHRADPRTTPVRPGWQAAGLEQSATLESTSTRSERTSEGELADEETKDRIEAHAPVSRVARSESPGHAQPHDSAVSSASLGEPTADPAELANEPSTGETRRMFGKRARRGLDVPLAAQELESSHGSEAPAPFAGVARPVAGAAPRSGAAEPEPVDAASRSLELPATERADFGGFNRLFPGRRPTAGESRASRAELGEGWDGSATQEGAVHVHIGRVEIRAAARKPAPAAAAPNRRAPAVDLAAYLSQRARREAR